MINVLLALFFGVLTIVGLTAFFDFRKETAFHQKIRLVNPMSSFFSSRRRLRLVVLAGGVFGVLLTMILFGPLSWMNICGGLFGAWIPWRWDQEKEKRKERRYVYDFPDFLELLAMAVTAGLTIEDAWRITILHLPQTPLKKELHLAYQALQTGQSKEAVFYKLRNTLKNDRLSSILTLLAHAIKMGSSVRTVLLEQAEALRTSTYIDVERRAQTVSIRLLFPIVFFILPSVFIVLFGSLLLTYVQRGGFF